MGFPGGSVGKSTPAVQELQEIWVQSLGWEDPLEEGMQPTPVFLPGEANGMDQFAVLLETESLPRYLTLARPGMDQAEVEAIKALLVGLDQTPEGPDILKTFEKTAKFDELPNAEAMLARMRQLYQVVDRKSVV